MDGRGAIKGLNNVFCLGREEDGCWVLARRCRGQEPKQQLLPRAPYTWWMLLALGSPLWDPSLIRISERCFSLFTGLICSKQGGKRREKKERISMK